MKKALYSSLPFF